LDKSFHQSQKNLRQSHLEEQCSALSYELETLKAANLKLSRKAEAAISQAERMDRDHTALLQEREAAIARAEAAEEELRQFKEGDVFLAHKQMKQDLTEKTEECLTLRGQLAQALGERDDAYSKLAEVSAPINIKVKAPKSASFSFKKMTSIEVKVKAPKMPSIEVDVKLNSHQRKDLRESQMQNLLDVFDELDEDGTEFAPRLDLRKQVEKYVPKCAEAQQLADYLRALDVMIVEKEDYEGYVQDWVEGNLH
jgi:superfamily II RNA helicase